MIQEAKILDEAKLAELVEYSKTLRLQITCHADGTFSIPILMLTDDLYKDYDFIHTRLLQKQIDKFKDWNIVYLERGQFRGLSREDGSDKLAAKIIKLEIKPTIHPGFPCLSATIRVEGPRHDEFYRTIGRSLVKSTPIQWSPHWFIDALGDHSLLKFVIYEDEETKTIHELRIIEDALYHVHEQLNTLVGECMGSDGKPQAPSKKTIAQARATLPAKFPNAFKKEKA